MAKIGPLWKSDPVLFLVQHKYPLLSFEDSFTGNAAKFADVRVAAEAFRAELESLPPNDISSRVDEVRRKLAEVQQKKLAEEENQRPFNKPETEADFIYWAKAAYWTVDEAVALSFGKDPRMVSWASLRSSVQISPFAKRFADRREIFRRAVAMGQLFEKNMPSLVTGWMKRLRIDVPQELQDAIADLGLVVGDWKTLADTRAKHIEALEQRLELEKHRCGTLTESLDELRGTAEAKPRKSAEARERATLLKMLIGMAIGGYGYDPTATRNNTLRDIAEDLEKAGVSVNDDTIRKYLNEAKEQLP